MKTQDLLKAYYAAFNSKKFDKMIDLLSEDVIHDVNQGERTKGRSAFVNFMKEMDEFYDENLKDIAIMVNLDESRAAAEFTCDGIYKTTAPGLPPAKNQKYSVPVGCFFEVKDGMITRVTNYYNMNEWVRQVK